MKRTSLAALAAAVALLGAACGGNGSMGGTGAEDTGGEKETGVTQVAIKAFDYTPADVTIAVGEEIEWTNGDDILHTVTSGTGQKQGAPGVSENVDAAPDGLFDAELDGLDATYSFTFEEAGSYDYYCAIHPGMTGTITVE